MVKKLSHPHDGKSIKTFLFYALAVLMLIAVSLTIKTIAIIQQSKYTDQHFTLALAENDKVRELVVFEPVESTLSVMKISDSDTNVAQLGTAAGISPDGTINVTGANAADLISEDISETLVSLGLRYPAIRTDLTIYDIGRLALFARNLPPNSKSLEELSSTQLIDDPQTEKVLLAFFSDEIIASENISIQIINASGVSGMAQRLERVLLHRGANVVSLTTARKKEYYSKIEYYGNETYTLKRIQQLLNLSATNINKKTIADIVITIGEKSMKTTVF